MRAAVGRLIIGGVGIVGVSLGAGASGLQASASNLPYAVPNGPVSANAAYNDLDCNGWAYGSQTVKANMRAYCTDPIALPDFINPYTGQLYGHTSPFFDNGHYVGHDEPSVKFISTVKGTGYEMTYFQQLSRDPSGTPTTSPSLAESASVSDYAELSPAPWFGMAICDPDSFPASATVSMGGFTPAPCVSPSSPGFDSNSESASGQAFMEMQFYPPGYGPWIDSASPDKTKWTAALNIDSLEAINATTPLTSGYETNPKCTEPVNFAFITHNGVPLGPPSPQQADLETFTTTPDGTATNPNVLYMSPGDTLKVVIDDVADPPGTFDDGKNDDTGGLRITIDDLTTGASGFMVASAANGFMNTNPATCQGTPFSFHGLYDTAAQQNQVSWAALEGGVLMEDEIGHAEVCAGTGSSGLANQDPVAATYPPSSDSYSDNSVYDICNDDTSDPDSSQSYPGAAAGEGGCAQETCQGTSTTEDSIGSNTFGGRVCGSSDTHCETADGYCIPQGSRTVDFNGAAYTWSDPVAYCDAARYQNGDLDYDGTPYQTDWPDGFSGHPTTFRYIGPFDAAGNPYPTVQLETDAAGSENDCDTSSGTGCTIPPYGAKFYPFWTLSSTPLGGVNVTGASSYCAWNFGDDGNPGELTNFGGEGPVPQTDPPGTSQYGSPGSHYKGTLITAPFSNPQISTITTIGGRSYTCPSFVLSQVSGTGPQPSTPEAPWMPALVLGAAAVGLTVLGVRRRRRA